MITREQLVPVEDRQKLIRIAVVALLALASVVIVWQLVLAFPSTRDEPLRPGPAASEGAAGRLVEWRDVP